MSENTCKHCGVGINFIRLRTEPDYCWSLGPRIGCEDRPVCFRPSGHSGPHRSHHGSGFDEQWGGPTMPVPESRRDEFWTPGAGE